MNAILTSEAFVKGVTSISDNVAGEYLRPAIVEAQEIGLQGIIGSRLYRLLVDMIATHSTRGDFSNDFSDDFAVSMGGRNNRLLALINKCQYYLAYQSVAELVTKVSVKIANAGVIRTTDDRMQAVSADDVDGIREYYQSKADFYALRLQTWLLDNREVFPELTSRACDEMRSNLYSAASCGIFLGGPRGRKC